MSHQYNDAEALAPSLALLFVSVVGSVASFCPKCPATSDFLNKTKLQIIWMKRSVQELYVSYVTYMDLLNLRPVCQSPLVPGFSSKNITREPESLMLQDLYRTLASAQDSLLVLKEHQLSNNPEHELYYELEKSSLSLAGLLSNIRCALCLQGVTPTRLVLPKRTPAVSGFSRKIEGCRGLWSYSKFIGHLARLFGKEFARGKRPGQQKKRSRQRHATSFRLTHQK
nr:leukemia inhibitory factor-like isoform X2 [Pogona vitticeps]